MTQISQLTSIDPRSKWNKINRRQCWNGAKALNIPFKTGATQPEMVSLFMQHGIAPEQVVNFVPIQHKNEKGDVEVSMYPEHRERKYDEHAELRRMEEFDKRIQAAMEKEKKIAEKDTDVEVLKKDISELKEMFAHVLQSLEKPKKAKETDPAKMKYMAFKKWCKDRGHLLQKGEIKEEIILKLEAKEHVKESPDGS